jgi:hypothetical protein
MSSDGSFDIVFHPQCSPSTTLGTGSVRLRFVRRSELAGDVSRLEMQQLSLGVIINLKFVLDGPILWHKLPSVGSVGCPLSGEVRPAVLMLTRCVGDHCTVARLPGMALEAPAGRGLTLPATGSRGSSLGGKGFMMLARGCSKPMQKRYGRDGKRSSALPLRRRYST